MTYRHLHVSTWLALLMSKRPLTQAILLMGTYNHAGMAMNDPL
jgi:hypothetical protein